MTPFEELLKRSIWIANVKDPDMTFRQAAIAAGAVRDAPAPVGRALTNERAAELGWRIIDGGAL